ncbi:hypothetical protein LCGC14_0903800 [marine sediment metagenome]|uniref:Uncharacterized protein n=1 Tax=marine sediment metagenome TaxID=412755 RepID=A0A0F9NVM5_9ZZZZ
MSKRIIQVYKSAYSDLNIIKRWFYDNFGFKIATYQAVAFALTTLKSFDLAAVKHINKIRVPPGITSIEKFSVTLDAELVERVDTFMRAHDRILIPDRPALIAALITYRAVSLPACLPIEPLDYKYPEYAKRPDEERYIRRMPELVKTALEL